jgi:hypothetical protein
VASDTISQSHQRRPYNFSLERVTRGNRFLHGRTRRSFGGVQKLMSTLIERLSVSGGEWCQSHAPSHIAARILKTSQLFYQAWLAGAKRRLMQRVDVIEHADEDLEPVSF